MTCCRQDLLFGELIEEAHSQQATEPADPETARGLTLSVFAIFPKPGCGKVSRKERVLQLPEKTSRLGDILDARFLF